MIAFLAMKPPQRLALLLVLIFFSSVQSGENKNDCKKTKKDQGILHTLQRKDCEVAWKHRCKNCCIYRREKDASGQPKEFCFGNGRKGIQEPVDIGGCVG